MKYLKRMKIHGFKKFENFEITFNQDTNILVGDNESGKSTILEAIDIVLSQKYKNYDKYIMKELLNKKIVNDFQNNPKIENLPTISIDLEFQLNPEPKCGLYYGMNHGFEKNGLYYGIRFKCEIPEDIKSELIPVIILGKVPYEYYQMSWSTFQGGAYNILHRPVNFLLIDNDTIDSTSSFNYYNKSLFSINHENSLQSKIKSEFRTKINEVFNELPINDVNEHQKFGINEKKIILENILTILDDNIPIENKGKGKENIIKTKIALDKNFGKVDVIAIEEPESHLSYTNLKLMIDEIKNQTGKQLVITTHESMIANSLNLKKILWIKEDHAESLKSIPEDDSKFFLKSSNNNMLQYIISKKVILVEGQTEYMLIPIIFEKTYNTTLEKEGISLIDCNGVSYKRYLSIAKGMNKRIAVITDNDKSVKNIEYMNQLNNETEDVHVFMDKVINNWTWEVCFYNLNKMKLDDLITIDEEANYLYTGHDYGKVLGKMLNNKVETAYLMYQNGFEYEVPSYIKECLEWIKR